MADTETRPTIQAAAEAFSHDFLQAMGGRDTRAILEWCKRDDLPPYYQFKACIILSASECNGEPEDDLACTKHYLDKAEEALQVAKRVYVHDAADAVHLELLEGSLRDEWAQYHARHRAMYSDSDDE